MVISIIRQTHLLLFSLLAGMLTGILFDIYRLIRGLENPNKILTFIEDILFWVFTSIVVFLFLLFTNQAYIGLYVYICIAAGIYVYMKLASRAFLAIEYRIITMFLKVFRIMANAAVYPFKLLIYCIKVKNKAKIKKKKLEEKLKTH